MARTAKNCVHCYTKNPGLTSTDHLINILCISTLLIAIMLLYKISFNEQLIQIADVEAAGFEKQYQRHNLLQNAENGWVGQWKNERIELESYVVNLKIMPSMRCLMTAGEAHQSHPVGT